ncbi:MAG: SycD/LcrH family type III secretion system chaperone [Verrucomicrobia bacterium]|nr:SycD/LcrH family type III secretion system chaperone [Verrucomicrobiota bacterium]
MRKKPVDFSSVNIGKMMNAMGDVNTVTGQHMESTLSMLFEGLKKGIVPKQPLGIGEEKIESLYTHAYTLYNQGKYKDASYLFLGLMVIDPGTSKHLMGCAACFHRQDMFEKAAQLYTLCAASDVKNPLPDFHAADCYIKLQFPQLAALHLKNAIDRAKASPEHALVKERAQIMLQTIEQEIEEMTKQAKKSEGKK